MKKHVLALAFALAIFPVSAMCQNADAQSKPNIGEGAIWQAVLADRPAQIIESPTVTNLTSDSATITWKTGVASEGELKYRSEKSPQWRTAADAGGSDTHVVNLTGLKPGEKYEFYVVASEQEGKTSGQFETLPASIGTPVNSTTKTVDIEENDPH